MSGAIVIVNPGHAMAEAYKKDLLEVYNSGGSMTGVNPKKELETEQLTGEELSSAIKGADEKYKDRFRCYYVTDEGHRQPDERQPFPVLVDGNMKTLVYALIEGTFEKFETDEAMMGVEATFFEEWLADKIKSVWTTCGGSVKKLFQLIDTNKFKDEAKAEMGTRGVIALISAEEAPVWVSKGNSEEAGKFTWGECSNKLTYEEPKAKEPDKPVKVDVAAMTYKERKAFLAANPNYDPNAAPAEPAKPDVKKDDNKPSVPTVVPAGVELEKATETGAIGVKKGRRYLFPPNNLNEEEKKKWYGKHGGSSKEYDWKNSVGIPIDKIVKSSHFFAMVHGPAAKDTDAHGAITKNERIVLTGPEIGEAFTVINKSTGYATLEELYATIDDTHPTFTVRLGKTLDSWPNLMRAPETELLKLSHKALVSLVHDFRIAHVKINPSSFGSTTVVHAPDKDKPAEPDVKVEDKPEGGKPIDIAAMTYKERKAYLKEHPEAAPKAA